MVFFEIGGYKLVKPVILLNKLGDFPFQFVVEILNIIVDVGDVTNIVLMVVIMTGVEIDGVFILPVDFLVEVILLNE